MNGKLNNEKKETSFKKKVSASINNPLRTKLNNFLKNSVFQHIHTFIQQNATWKHTLVCKKIVWEGC